MREDGEGKRNSIIRVNFYFKRFFFGIEYFSEI